MDIESVDDEIKVRIGGLSWFVRVYHDDQEEVRIFGKTILRRNIFNRCRLGASYNLYDGEELLESSVRSIRRECSFINVIYQDVSNLGEKRDSLEPFLSDLRQKGVIDDYHRYDPDLKLMPYENEKNKRVLGFEICKRHGCTHYLDMDIDEFYCADELKYAKRMVLAHSFDITACSWFDYIKSPTYRFLIPSVHCVPLITRIPRFRHLLFKGEYPCSVDGTRSLIRKGKFYIFTRDEIAMHHMSYVRKDISKKFRNSSLQACDEAKMVLRRREQEILKWLPECRVVPENIRFLGDEPIVCSLDKFDIGDVV